MVVIKQAVEHNKIETDVKALICWMWRWQWTRCLDRGCGRLGAGTLGSSDAQAMDICPCLCVLCCPVYVETSRRADPLLRESYQMQFWILTGHKAQSIKVMMMIFI
jgi:hypothetical protein